MKKVTFERAYKGVVNIIINGHTAGMIFKHNDNKWYIYLPCSNIPTNAPFEQLRFAKTAVRAEFGDDWQTVNPWLTVRDEITNGGY